MSIKSTNEKKHGAQKRCRQRRLDLDGDAQGCGDQSDSHEGDPKRLRRNPARNDVRDIRRIGKMLRSEHGQRNRQKQSPERHDLIEPVRLR